MEILQGVQVPLIGVQREELSPRCAPVPEIKLALNINTGASQADHLPAFHSTSHCCLAA